MSGGDDCTLRIWKDGETQQSIVHPGPVWRSDRLCSSGDIVTACGDGVVRIWTQSEKRVASAEVISAYQVTCEQHVRSVVHLSISISLSISLSLSIYLSIYLSLSLSLYMYDLSRCTVGTQLAVAVGACAFALHHTCWLASPSLTSVAHTVCCVYRELAAQGGGGGSLDVSSLPDATSLLTGTATDGEIRLVQHEGRAMALKWSATEKGWSEVELNDQQLRALLRAQANTVDGVQYDRVIDIAGV
jgi:WD40 repeat protein